MSILRLRQRVPSAKRVGAFSLYGHDLRFHKKSNDGSAKCDAFETRSARDYIIGALFHISEKEILALDRAEGLGFGYEKKTIDVYNHAGASTQAFMYYATHIDGLTRQIVYQMQIVTSCLLTA